MEVIPKNGEPQLVTRVPHYDFNWQSIYWLKNPILAPKGSMLRTTAHWDNSSKNPDNPNPNDWVRYGLWTDNEMLNSYSHVVLTHQVLGFDIKDGRLVGKFDDAQKEPPPWLLQTGTITDAAGTD